MLINFRKKKHPKIKTKPAKTENLRLGNNKKIHNKKKTKS